MTQPQVYNWLTPDEWNKLKFRTRANTTLILKAFNTLGLQELVPGATDAFMDLFEQTWDIVRGKDKPLRTPPFAERYMEDRYDAD